MGTDPEEEPGADVSEDCVAHMFAELPQVLVREHEAEAVLPRLGQDRWDRARYEVLKLIEVAEERGRASAAPHGCEVQGRENEGANERGHVLAEPADGQVDDENDALLEVEVEVESRTLTSKHWARNRMRDQAAELVHDRRERFRAEPRRERRELPLPYVADVWIEGPIDDALTQILVEVETVKKAEARARVVGNREDAEPQVVLHARSPGIRPSVLEHRDELAREESVLCYGRGPTPKDVERGRGSLLSGRDPDDEPVWCRRGKGRDLGSERPVGIKYREPHVVLKVLRHQRANQGRLPGSGLPDDPCVTKSVLRQEPEPGRVAAKDCFPEDGKGPTGKVDGGHPGRGG